MRVADDHLIIVDDPGGPMTEEDRRLARLWFEDAIYMLSERRKLRDVTAVTCDTEKTHRP